MNVARAAEIVLRLVLAACAFGWGISIFAVVMPPEMAFAHLERLSGREVEVTPALSYWLKMAGAGFTFIALLFAFCMVHPDRLPGLTGAVLVFQIACGIVLIWAASGTDLEPWTYLNDVLFCFSTGGLGLVALKLRSKH